MTVARRKLDRCEREIRKFVPDVKRSGEVEIKKFAERLDTRFFFVSLGAKVAKINRAEHGGTIIKERVCRSV